MHWYGAEQSVCYRGVLYSDCPFLELSILLFPSLTAPLNSPTDVYASDIGTDSFRVNWRYSETPPPGTISSFKIGLYYKDSRYPSRHGEHIRDMTFALSEIDRWSFTFSYLVMYLDPGMEYNVLISAMTSAGEGPPARIGQKTMNTGKDTA